MLKNNTTEFKAFFLLNFTKQLIKHSEKRDFFLLEKLIRDKTKKELPKSKINPELIKEKIHEIEHPKKHFIKPLPKLGSEKLNISPIPRKRFRIPEIRLPPRLQYLKPTQTHVEIDLDKLNPLI